MPPFDSPSFHQGLEHGLLVALPSGEEHNQRFAVPFCAQMELGTETTPAASQRLISPTFAGSRCMLVRTNHRPIDEMKRPVDLSALVCCLLQGGEELVPEAAVLPGVKSVGDGAPGTIALRQVAPGGSSGQNPEDSIEHHSVGMIGMPPFFRTFGREQGGQTLPLRVSQCMSIHNLSVYHICRTRPRSPQQRRVGEPKPKRIPIGLSPEG